MIDLEESNKYNLFKDIKGFQSAVFLKLQDGSYIFKITYLDETTSAEKVKRIPTTVSAIIQYGCRIDTFDEIKAEKYQQFQYEKSVPLAKVLEKASGFEISLGIYRWIKLEYNRGITNFLDLGIWFDFQPLLIGWSTIGVFSELGNRHYLGGFSFRTGFGYGLGVLGDNIAGHGIEGSGENSQGFLYELEAMNSSLLDNKVLFIQQIGLLITNQRNPERSKWGGDVNKLTSIPYLGLGIETICKKVNFFVIARITYVNRIKDEHDFVFPDAKLGVFWYL